MSSCAFLETTISCSATANNMTDQLLRLKGSEVGALSNPPRTATALRAEALTPSTVL